MLVKEGAGLSSGSFSSDSHYGVANDVISAIFGKLHASGSADTLGDGTGGSNTIVNIL